MTYPSLSRGRKCLVNFYWRMGCPHNSVGRIRLWCRRPKFDPCLGKFPWRRDRLPSPVFLGFPGGSAGKESACKAGDLGSMPGAGKIPWRRERLCTPVFWPGEFHGLYSPWGHKESDTTERLSLEYSCFTL